MPCGRHILVPFPTRCTIMKLNTPSAHTGTLTPALITRPVPGTRWKSCPARRRSCHDFSPFCNCHGCDLDCLRRWRLGSTRTRIRRSTNFTTAPALIPSGPLSIDAGYGRVVLPGNQVTVSATVTEDETSTIACRQTAGAQVTLDQPDELTPSFTAPSVGSSETPAFEVTAQSGDTTATDSVLVEIWVADQDPNNGALLGDFSTQPGWACDRDPVTPPELTTEYYTNGIPTHATRTFPNQGNPKTIHTVFQTWHIPKAPERTNTATEMAMFGITLDGIKLERDTAESFRNEGVWRYKAITPMKPATPPVAGPASGAPSGAGRQERCRPARDCRRKFPAESTAPP